MIEYQVKGATVECGSWLKRWLLDRLLPGTKFLLITVNDKSIGLHEGMMVRFTCKECEEAASNL